MQGIIDELPIETKKRELVEAMNGSAVVGDQGRR
jgi:hypothetical protein